MTDASFAAKLQLVLKALSLSRGRLAADLNVDKSLVGRWAAGAITPSDHNLQRLTERIAQARPGFSMLDWDRSLAELAERLGVETPAAAPAFDPDIPAGFGRWLPPMTTREVIATTEQQAWCYEGFWRTTRVTAEAPGRFWHDYTYVRQGSDGMLLQRVAVAGHAFEGWLIPLRNQLFSMAAHELSGVLAFSILNGVSRVKAEVLDGISLGCLADAGSSPVATPIILERVGDLTGDRKADETRFAALMREPFLAPEGSVPQRIQNHLYRDFGPTAFASGGDAVLKLFHGLSLSRGPSFASVAPPSPPADGPSAAILRPDFGRHATATQ